MGTLWQPLPLGFMAWLAWLRDLLDVAALECGPSGLAWMIRLVLQGRGFVAPALFCWRHLFSPPRARVSTCGLARLWWDPLDIAA